jgi:hypothetical protein
MKLVMSFAALPWQAEMSRLPQGNSRKGIENAHMHAALHK